MDELCQRFYPGDASIDENSKETKLIRDGVEFLEDLQLIQSVDKGYTSTCSDTTASCDLDTRLRILQAIRNSENERSYDHVLTYVSRENKVVFDKDSELRDWMNEYAPDETWSGNALQYWTRAIDALGVGTRLKDSGESDADVGLFPDDELVLALLSKTIDGDSAQLRSVLNRIHQQYLPILDAEEAVSDYFESAINDLYDKGTIDLDHKDDGGVDVVVEEESYNRISITK